MFYLSVYFCLYTTHDKNALSITMFVSGRKKSVVSEKWCLIPLEHQYICMQLV